MATNMYKKYTESKTREWPVPEGTQAGEGVTAGPGAYTQVGVTLTARGDSVAPANIPGVTGGTVPNGGAGNKPNCATVAVDGSWLFAVEDAVDGDTTADEGATPLGTPVFLTPGGGFSVAEDAGETGNYAGQIDDGIIVDGVAPVRIGGLL